MKQTKKLAIFSIVILFSLFLTLIFPVSVLADDPTPPPVETPVVVPPTDVPVATEEPVLTEATPLAPTATEEPVMDDPIPTVTFAVTEVPVSDEASATEETIDVDLTGIVQQLDSADLVLLDENGESIPMSSNQAVQALTAPDPIGCPPGVLPVSWGGTGAGCTTSYTSIQDAINDPLVVAGWTVYVEFGIYHEQVVITKGNITLMGDPGDPTLAGPGPNAPILDGSGVSGDTGITIQAEGITLIGFVIQNFDTAIYQPVISGSNTVNILNNTIQNNIDGIKIIKGTGSPGTEIHYNIFAGNKQYDLINNDSSSDTGNNQQFVQAQNNYWGCPTGPVVAYKKFKKVKGQDVFEGWAYIDWATKHDYGLQGDGDDPNPACAVLYGFDDKYDFQLNSNDYSPYKINIGTSMPGVEGTPTNTPTNIPTNTPTDTPTNTPTDTPTNTPTNTPVDTPTNTATNTPTDTPTNTPVNIPTDTPTNTPTDTPTNTPADTPTNTPANPPTNTPINTPPATATPTPLSTRIPVNPLVPFAGIVPVTGGETHAIAAGIAHTCAITPEGGVQCWGNNEFGQLGDGTNNGSNVPVNVIGIGGGTTIVAGGNHTCVLSGGDVWCWGQNSQGQLGDGTTTDRNVPVNVLSNVVDITAGLEYTCAITTFGQVMCWGKNDQGQLADGTRTDRTWPTLASLISGISNVDAGQTRSCGLTSTGLLRCLSNGSAQEIGGIIPATGGQPESSLDVAVNRFGSTIVALNDQGMPVMFQAGRFKAIQNVTNAVDVDSGFGHICSLINNGQVKCWGSNYYGQLGRNSRTSSSEPQAVLNVSSAWQLAVGKYHACVLIISNLPGEDDIQCWGLNSDGQLGNGTNESSLIPVFVK